MTPFHPSARSAFFAAVIGLSFSAPIAYAQNPCAPGMNPCAAKTPMPATNPCAAKGKVDPKLVTRPAGTRLVGGNHDELVELGKHLYSDPKLSTNGLSCNTCHSGGAAFANTFAKPYPHFVQMAGEKGGFKQIALDEMVQFCMAVPMAAKPLGWNSRELAALTAYTGEVQKTFKPSASAARNPCAAGNPCAARNPCAPKR